MVAMCMVVESSGSQSADKLNHGQRHKSQHLHGTCVRWAYRRTKASQVTILDERLCNGASITKESLDASLLELGDVLPIAFPNNPL